MDSSRIILVLLLCCLFKQEVISQDSACMQQFRELRFEKNSVSLSKKHRLILDSVVSIVDKCPDYCISIGWPMICFNQRLAEISWKRIDAVATYLYSKSSNKDQLVVTYSDGGQTGV